ncbi:molybdate ABC transporter substrate-binding protein [Brevibacterium paucivorans]|nr:molybdate ABC transporter substrate-binding protein [Brevibacterium paucivorans]
MMKSLAAVVALTLTCCALTSCGKADPGSSLTVFAAASLKKSFEEIGKDFEEETGTAVALNFAGSSGLVEQMKSGAPAQVFASADEPTMDTASQAGLVHDPRIFATNTLTIAVPRGNPANITGLEALSRPGVKVAVCAPAVPCGNATRKLLSRRGVPLKPATEESKVTAVLTKVESGQVDAGLVYVTDARASDKVEAVDLPQVGAVVNRYPIAVTSQGEKTASAAQFVEFVLSERAQQVLQSNGFGQP